MLGTFFAYLSLGDTSGVENLPELVLFVGLATSAWAVGYRHGIYTFPMKAFCGRYGDDPDANEQRHSRSARRWVWASGIYFIIYGGALLALYGATPEKFWRTVTKPGEAYAAKFETIEGLTTQATNPLLQVLTLSAILQLPLAPLLGYFWGQLSNAVRLAAVLGCASYVAFFLYIGTLQGLGFLLIGLLAGLLARRHRPDVDHVKAKRSRRRATALIGIGLALFGIYFANAQADRLQVFEVKETQRFKPNPYVEAVVGHDLARGLRVVVHYPTHGYEGLAYNLETALEEPFLWTEGRGSSRGVDSYWDQYFGESVLKDTYMGHTEVRTGWSATIAWATVYPWLASDFTWPGTLILMLFIGRWTARMWLRTIAFHDPLTLILFSQLALFVAFVSINNQLLISRPALVAVASVVALHLARETVAIPAKLSRQIDTGVRVAGIAEQRTGLTAGRTARVRQGLTQAAHRGAR
jgi:hypothetical protein